MEEEKIEEGMKVTIEEEPEMEEEDKDKVYELNTGQSMQAELLTEPLQGELKALIIENSEIMDISIISSLGYTLFEEIGRQGTHYFPLKATALNYKAKQFNFVAESYYLNEPLIISVKGSKNSNLKLILRFC